MPQINFYTYLSQTTWTLLLFSFLFFVMKQYFLPLILENIKIKNLMNYSTSNKLETNSKISLQYNILD